MSVVAADPGWRGALRGSTWAFAASRLLVWAVGVTAFAVLPAGRDIDGSFGPAKALGRIGSYALAPALRYDSEWYVAIARDGYENTIEPAFFPLYPLTMRVGSEVFGNSIPTIGVIGVLVSLVAFAATLLAFYRLSAIELGEGAAGRAAALLAFFPTAMFFSAVYTESLFLALEIGALLAARRQRWAWAGVLAALGSATRNSGFILLLPLVLLYLYAPREEEGPDRPTTPRWRPRYSLRPDVLWLALAPAGAAAYLAYCGVHYHDALAPLHAVQDHFSRSTVGPVVTFGRGALDAVRGVGDLFDGGASVQAALRNIAQFVIAVAALAISLAMFRRLPVAYGAYSLAMLAWALSTAVPGHALFSTGRYIGVIFPLFMWLGWRLEDRRALRGTLVVFAVGLVYFSATFATFRFVA